MTVDPKILSIIEIVVCPKCRGKLTASVELLTCAQCNLEYPIRNGIPVLLIDAATKKG